MKSNISGTPFASAMPSTQSGDMMGALSPMAQNFMRGKARLFGLGQGPGPQSSNPIRPQGQESNSMLRFSY